jgi:hypothetical protein
MRRQLLELLDGPRLRVLERRSAEADVLAQLKGAGLADASLQTLFPGSAMAFVAAPGGVWHGHHCYPGGLADHTLFNLRSGLGMAAAYRLTYGVAVDDDMVRAAAIMHDAAKTVTLHWKEDGTLPATEPMVAGTGLHHILAVAEALVRGWPPRLVVSVAAAHSPPKPGPDLDKLIGYLRAAALIAGKTPAQAGLSDDGKSLSFAPGLEVFISYLDDHDSVVTETTIKTVDGRLGPVDPWSRDEALSRTSDLARYSADLEFIKK